MSVVGCFQKKLIQFVILALLSIISLLVFLKTLIQILPGKDFDLPSLLQTKQAEEFLDLGYLDFLIKMFRLQFGNSLIYPEKSVGCLIVDASYYTFQLAIPAFLLIIFMAFAFSILGVVFKNSWVEVWVDEVFIFFLSLPILLYAPLLVLTFAIWLSWFPLAFLSDFKSFILPLMALTARPMARFGSLLKEKLISESLKPYVVVAIAKGCSPVRILFFHLFKGTLTLWVRSLGLIAMSLFSGSFLIETLFSINGLGYLFVSALSERDYPVIAALVFILGSCFIMLNLILEFFQEAIDPQKSIWRDS